MVANPVSCSEYCLERAVLTSRHNSAEKKKFVAWNRVVIINSSNVKDRLIAELRDGRFFKNNG